METSEATQAPTAREEGQLGAIGGVHTSASFPVITSVTPTTLATSSTAVQSAATVSAHVSSANGSTKAYAKVSASAQAPQSQQPKTELLCHYPGAVTAVNITLLEGTKSSGDVCNEVNFRLVLKSVGIVKDPVLGLRRREQSETMLDAVPVVNSDNSVPVSSSGSMNKQEHVPAVHSKKRPNGGDNWVERLEKKYSKPIISSPLATGHMESHGGGKQGGKTSKRKADHGDFYELDDPFIDDSEVIEDVNREIIKRSTKTVHSGFFVSTGALEVVADKNSSHQENISDEPPKKKKKKIKGKRLVEEILAKVKDSGRKRKKGEGKDKDKDKGMKQIDKAKVVANQQTPSKSSQHVVPEFQSTSATPVDVGLSDSYFSNKADYNNSAEKDEEDKNQQRSKVVKPLWQPSEAAMEALSAFKRKVDNYFEARLSSSLQDSSRGKIDKKSFPRALDQALLEVDRIIEKHHKNVTKKYSGYVEQLCEIVSPEISVTIMRRAITRVNAVAVCSLAKEKYTSSVAELEKLITQSICSAPTAEEQRKAYQLQKEKESAKKSQPISTTTAGAGTVEEPVAMAEVSEQPAVADGVSNVIIDGPSVIYDYVAKWTPAMRVLLVDCELSCRFWVEAENAARATLTASEKKLLTQLDQDVLVERTEIDSLFKRIVAAFPANCMYGNIHYIKSALGTEKSRQKRVQSRESDSHERPEKKAAATKTPPVPTSSHGGKRPFPSTTTQKSSSSAVLAAQITSSASSVEESDQHKTTTFSQPSVEKSSISSAVFEF